MLKNKDHKKSHMLLPLLESDLSDQFKESFKQAFEELQDMIGRYKEKRNLLEVKLKLDNDPRRPEFYSIIARLSLLDIIIGELEFLNRYSNPSNISKS